MYKLCLIQNRPYWDWHLQPIEPRDWPFDLDRAEYSGHSRDLREAMRHAHEFVPRNKVSYVYMDRIPE